MKITENDVLSLGPTIEEIIKIEIVEKDKKVCAEIAEILKKHYPATLIDTEKVYDLVKLLETVSVEMVQNEIRAEAVKEFAARLKDAFPEGNRDYKAPTIGVEDFCEIIDLCVDEFIEETK